MDSKKMLLGLFLIFFGYISITNAQNTKLQLVTIKKLFDTLKIQQNDDSIYFLQQKIDSAFIVLISNPNSFISDFNILKDNCILLKSSDSLLKIITWYVFYPQAFTYRYYGYVLYRPDKKQYIYFKLTDKSDQLTSPESLILSDTSWFGCLYYDIITNKHNKTTYYTLLGWDGNNLLTNKKIIEVMTIDNNRLIFGSDFFVDNKYSKRLIFEYSKSVSMLLRWHKRMQMIVWDHLSPSSPKFQGLYQYYGPDFTYDGLEFKQGKWIWKSNILVLPDK